MSLEAGVVARAHRAVEPLHGLIYFAPEQDEELIAVGIRPGRMCYFASRSAPMGACSAGTVSATFYNFNPDVVARLIPRAWTLADPETVLAARFRAADRAWRRLLDDDALASAELAELAGLMRRAATNLDPAGRPLYAAHDGLEWPDDPHLAVWHGASLLREHRGDGHIAALVAAGLSGIEAIVSHTGTGRGFTVQVAKLLRGWSDEQWDAAGAALTERGLMADGGLSDAGIALRAHLESETDRLAEAPYQRLGAEGTARLIELGKQFSKAIVANGAFPADVFASTSH